MQLTIMFPVLDEELRLKKGIDATMAYLRENIKVPCHLMILDNGSTDETPEIGRQLCLKYPEVSYVKIPVKGVGTAFRKGVELNKNEIVGYMDIDLSTDIRHLGQVVSLFQDNPRLMYINGTRFHPESETKGRKWYRRLTSRGLLFLLRTVLKMKASDALCGFTFLRKEAVEELVSEAGDEPGWFYTVELLLRAERKGFLILDLPVKWVDDYNTTVRLGPTIKNYLRQIRRLRRIL